MRPKDRLMGAQRPGPWLKATLQEGPRLRTPVGLLSPYCHHITVGVPFPILLPSLPTGSPRVLPWPGPCRQVSPSPSKSEPGCLSRSRGSPPGGYYPTRALVVMSGDILVVRARRWMLLASSG